MAASKPTCLYFLENKQSYTLNFYLGTLAYDLGCFPFDLEPSRPKSVYFTFLILSLWVSLISKKPIKRSPRSISALPKIFFIKYTT